MLSGSYRSRHPMKAVCQSAIPDGLTEKSNLVKLLCFKLQRIERLGVFLFRHGGGEVLFTEDVGRNARVAMQLLMQLLQCQEGDPPAPRR